MEFALDEYFRLDLKSIPNPNLGDFHRSVTFVKKVTDHVDW